MTNPFGNPIAWFAAAPAVAQVALLAALLSLVSIGVACASLVASWRQARTSSSALFASLLTKRIDWLDNFRSAVKARLSEINAIDTTDTYNSKPLPYPEALFRVLDAKRMASWLFDEAVGDMVQQIVMLLEQQTTLTITARTQQGVTSLAAAREVASVSMKLDAAYNQLLDEIRPFLYVGDVKNYAGYDRARFGFLRNKRK